MTTLSYGIADTSIGTIVLIGAERGLREVHWAADKAEAKAWRDAYYPESLEVPGFFTQSFAAIERFLAGEGPLKLPYELVGGTALQRMVWIALSKIPYGETVSYTTLADRIGFPRAVRAVASACGANPLPLVIPCHRVIAKDGSLGGFSMGGVKIKEKLLALEAQAVSVAA
jgi:O-6-methylguanine DNA methyltransferase